MFILLLNVGCWQQATPKGTDRVCAKMLVCDKLTYETALGSNSLEHLDETHRFLMHPQCKHMCTNIRWPTVQCNIVYKARRSGGSCTYNVHSGCRVWGFVRMKRRKSMCMQSNKLRKALKLPELGLSWRNYALIIHEPSEWKDSFCGWQKWFVVENILV